ncbi:MAG: biotin--[acetyl-CoA-carboxylase] ligase [Zestosphaera tikiterensis]|uniref:Biotin--[acetyl-CoA-carboxylase] ligase n=1 Tax=Zestosphaera tikiterensis TaxID=1973259 RepID=A0A2R7Y8I0_9CREN|nr:MAG: biotin--[acetyl-CoA-carboxylase] ligase [Zestosphaera tikiterensis]
MSNSAEVLKEVLKYLEVRKGSYVSGSELAEVLGVSRSTVNKYVLRLKDLGYVIESHPKFGYRLVNADDLSLANAYLRDLRTDISFKVVYVRRCDSTQDVAEQLASQGVEEGLVVVAEELTSGRGRLGRRWVANEGGLYFTVVLRPRYVRGLQLLSFAAGVAVAEALKGLHNVDVKLKWPNDVLLNEKKVAGILIEAKAEADKVRYVLLGVGVNVNNELPEDLRETAITLKEFLGKSVDRVPILRGFLKNLDTLYKHLRAGEYDKVIKSWKGLSTTLGRYVKAVTVDGKEILGRAVDVDLNGSLIIESSVGRVKLEAGDVYHLR